MAFPQQFLDELTSRCDIVDVVSSYVTLTKKGSNYFGLCPFHNEKTPSMKIFDTQAEPQELVDYILYLCSENGRCVTGSNHVMDCGRLTMKPQ